MIILRWNPEVQQKKRTEPYSRDHTHPPAYAWPPVTRDCNFLKTKKLSAYCVWPYKWKYFSVFAEHHTHPPDPAKNSPPRWKMLYTGTIIICLFSSCSIVRTSRDRFNNLNINKTYADATKTKEPIPVYRCLTQSVLTIEYLPCFLISFRRTTIIS